MQIIDRKTFPWSAGTLLAFAAATGAYIPYAHAHPTGPRGGSWPGLIYAIVGSLLIVIALLLTLRKRFRTARIGRAYLWMQAHVWFGALSYPVILYHAGLRFGGPLTSVLMWIFTAVVVTGVLGLALQQFLPRKLKRDVPRETVIGQIEHVMDRLMAEAESLVAAAERGGARAGRGPSVPSLSTSAAQALSASSGQPLLASSPVGATAVAVGTATFTVQEDRQRLLLRSYYEQEILPLLDRTRSPRLKPGAWEAFDSRFGRVRAQFPPALHEPMDDLHGVVQERAQLETQRKLHRLLHGWLFVHVPLSYAMLVLAIIHAIKALKYASIGGW